MTARFTRREGAGRESLFLLTAALIATAVAVLATTPNPRPVRAQSILPEPVGPESIRAQSESFIYLPLALARGDVRRLPTARAATAVPPSPAPTATPTATATEAEPTEEPSPTPTEEPSPTPTAPGYREPLTDFADLSDLRAGYRATQWYETLLAILERRYPTGRYIVASLDNSRTNAQLWVGGRTGTFDQLLGTLDLTVHEMNHQLGIQQTWLPSHGEQYGYTVRADLVVTVTNHNTYPRSEIARYVTGDLVNTYKNTYLTGQSGTQGFTNLLDEVNAYTHSLFTAYGVYDQMPPNQRASHRDGLVTFMMYTQFYLRHAREHHAADYALLSDDPEMRSLVALLWGRANFILDTTQAISRLSMSPESIEAEMRKTEMQDEITRFVGDAAP